MPNTCTLYASSINCDHCDRSPPGKSQVVTTVRGPHTRSAAPSCQVPHLSTHSVAPLHRCRRDPIDIEYRRQSSNRSSYQASRVLNAAATNATATATANAMATATAAVNNSLNAFASMQWWRRDAATAPNERRVWRIERGALALPVAVTVTLACGGGQWSGAPLHWQHAVMACGPWHGGNHWQRPINSAAARACGRGVSRWGRCARLMGHCTRRPLMQPTTPLRPTVST